MKKVKLLLSAVALMSASFSMVSCSGDDGDGNKFSDGSYVEGAGYFYKRFSYMPISGTSNEIELTGYQYDKDAGPEVVPPTSINIPQELEFDGKRYTVTKIGTSALNGLNNITSVTLPSTITSIGDHAMEGMRLVSSFTFPSSLKSIGDHAFDGWESLTSLNLPVGLTTIGECAFIYCGNITAINLPESLVSIGERAFYGMEKLTSIVLPSTLRRLDQEAFGSPVGGNLLDITCKAVVPPTMPPAMPHAFDMGSFDNATLRVPAESVEAYKAAEGWKDFKNIVAM